MEINWNLDPKTVPEYMHTISEMQRVAVACQAAVERLQRGLSERVSLLKRVREGDVEEERPLKRRAIERREESIAEDLPSEMFLLICHALPPDAACVTLSRMRRVCRKWRDALDRDPPLDPQIGFWMLERKIRVLEGEVERFEESRDSAVSRLERVQENFLSVARPINDACSATIFSAVPILLASFLPFPQGGENVKHKILANLIRR